MERLAQLIERSHNCLIYPDLKSLYSIITKSPETFHIFVLIILMYEWMPTEILAFCYNENNFWLAFRYHADN